MQATVDVLGVPDAARDALIAAALDPPDRAREAWHRWERAGIDATTDPVAQRWLPLIGWNLQHTELDSAARTLFQNARRDMWVSNVRLLEAARPALDALNANGIRTIALKGAALALTVYEMPGLRPIGDVDLMVEPDQADRAQRLLNDLGWRALRHRRPADRMLVQAVDLRKPPHGALDLHWYLLRECCWPGVDQGVWQRAQPLTALPGALVLSPADQLLHTCLHGLRWSPVHGGHWVADAVRVIAHAGEALQWDVLVDEAKRRTLSLQMLEALKVVRERGHADIPERVLRALTGQSAGWSERWECRFKGHPVVSARGLFVIWAGWRRIRRGARASGAAAPSWLRYLAAAIGVETPAALIPRFARHAWQGATGWLS